MRAPLVVGVLTLAAGIAAGAQRSVSIGDGPFFVALALAGAIPALYLARPRATGGSGRVVLGLLLMAGGLLGVAARSGADRSCAAWLPEPALEVRGVLTQGAGDRLRLVARSVEVAGVTVPCGEELPARFDGPIPTPGSDVVGRGRWWRPPGASGVRTPGLLLLDSLKIASGAGVGSPLPGPGPADADDVPEVDGVETAARAATLRPWTGLAAVRTAARARVDTLFGDGAPLAASLLLAQRDGLDRDVRDQFTRAGLSHLLAISGLHVALVAGILLLLGGAVRLGKRGAAAVAGGGTVGYVAFLGAPYSASRAAVQIVMVLLARAAQRPARTEALMATAALILLAADPGALFSPGFQLSFAGVAGILVLRRPLLKRLSRLAGLRVAGRPVGRWVADGLSTSVAATVATAPIVAWHFGRVAPIGIVANLVAIPLLSLTVPALAVSLLAGWLWLPAGAFLAGSGRVLLDALHATARVAASVPGAAVTVTASAAVLGTAAVVAGYLATRRLGRTRWAVRGVVWVGVAAAVLLVAPVRPGLDRVEIHVIDVGQGDAIGIRSPGGRWLLVDAGVARNGYDAGARLVVPYLARRGVRRLEGLIVTHPDADHMGGASAVMDALRPRWVADPGMAAAKGGYLTLLRSAADQGVPWVTARRGMELELDGVVIEILYPAGGPSEDANAASVVLRLRFGEFEAVLTGDAPASVERRLVRRYGRRLQAEVLKVGHHGSVTSTTPELLDATGATLALISAGRGNRYGHPHRAVLDRLAGAGLTVARTDRDGSLVVRGRRDGRYELATGRGTVAR